MTRAAAIAAAAVAAAAVAGCSATYRDPPIAHSHRSSSPPPRCHRVRVDGVQACAEHRGGQLVFLRPPGHR